jgi:hypothetical protein
MAMRQITKEYFNTKKCKYSGPLYFVDWVLNDEKYHNCTLKHIAVTKVKNTEQTEGNSSCLATIGTIRTFQYNLQ